MNDPLPTGALLKEKRNSAGLTQRELAARAGLHLNSVNSLEQFAVVPGTSWHALGLVSKVLRDCGAKIPVAWTDWRMRWRSARFPTAGSGGRAMGSYAAVETNSVRGAVASQLTRVFGRPPRRLSEAATRAGGRCRCKALPNGRCKFHGGFSTGPRTPEGRARIAEAQRRRWAARRGRVTSMETGSTL